MAPPTSSSGCPSRGFRRPISRSSLSTSSTGRCTSSASPCSGPAWPPPWPERRADLPERSRAALDLLSADVERFQRLVEDLLEISRYDAGVADLHLEDVRLTELVIRAVASVGGPPVEFGPGAVADGLAIQVDKRRMERVIANLVENAARYGGGATRVIVDAGHYVARV